MSLSVRATIARVSGTIVAVLRERPRAGDRGLARLRGERRRDALPGEHLLDLGQPPWNRRHAAEHDARAAAHVVLHVQNDGGADDGVASTLRGRDLVVRAARAGSRTRQRNEREHLAVLQHVLARRVDGRQP